MEQLNLNVLLNRLEEENKLIEYLKYFDKYSVYPVICK